jgi:hypothetical protein
MDQQNKIALRTVFLLVIMSGVLQGCWFTPPPKLETVAVAQKCSFPKVARACKKVPKKLQDIPISKIERAAVEKFHTMTPAQQNSLLEKFKGRFIEILGNSITTRGQYVRLSRNYMACVRHNQEIRKLCQ